jgi:hypothetical protein
VIDHSQIGYYNEKIERYFKFDCGSLKPMRKAINLRIRARGLCLVTAIDHPLDRDRGAPDSAVNSAIWNFKPVIRFCQKL